MKNNKKIVFIVYAILVFICLAVCMSATPLYAQSFEYYDGRKVYDGTETIKDNFPFDEKLIVDRTYYPSTDELIIEVRMYNKTWDEDLVEFGVYCAIMNFIEDDLHRYYGYKISSRNTQYNKSGTVYNLRTVKCILKR